jgi:hypothetical protein
MLRRIRLKDTEGAQAANSDFSAFLKSAPANLTPEQREQLFREFLQWQKNQRNNTPPGGLWR